MSSSDLDFSIGADDGGSQRRAFRAKIPGVAVYVPIRKETFDVADLSAMGLAFMDSAKGFTEGQVIEFDLLINKKVFLNKLTAKVMRVLDKGIIGCNFEGVDHRKEVKLDKLVLEVQKRLIAIKKKSRE
ncbi:PilZ domain-containing protein [Desulfovibrio ferrophilus]|uniref:Type IV pilus assembly PilZ n=1 Tax=Desulfovibrio ferrophilus TaxID=241368 RepID=A0A2Z6AXW0_9BACT|nr:PilZ domain-containing protein [Desulfovibrio ferrophilus]BBD08102.1 type IV pilus assembly PilZ [Desulfovibrio ferrophilus]